jgi:hypothetical protein
VVSNSRSVALSELDATPSGGTLPKTIVSNLAPGKTLSVTVATKKSCVFNLHGAYADGSSTDSTSVDLCKDKKVNLVEWLRWVRNKWLPVMTRKMGPSVLEGGARANWRIAAQTSTAVDNMRRRNSSRFAYRNVIAFSAFGAVTAMLAVFFFQPSPPLFTETKLNGCGDKPHLRAESSDHMDSTYYGKLIGMEISGAFYCPISAGGSPIGEFHFEFQARWLRQLVHEMPQKPGASVCAAIMPSSPSLGPIAASATTVAERWR